MYKDVIKSILKACNINHTLTFKNLGLAEDVSIKMYYPRDFKYKNEHANYGFVFVRSGIAVSVSIGKNTFQLGGSANKSWRQRCMEADTLYVIDPETMHKRRKNKEHVDRLADRLRKYKENKALMLIENKQKLQEIVSETPKLINRLTSFLNYECATTDEKTYDKTWYLIKELAEMTAVVQRDIVRFEKHGSHIYVINVKRLIDAVNQARRIK